MAHTEALVLSDYTYKVTVRSKIINGLLVDAGTVLQCPRCGSRQPVPKHGETTGCGSCLLNYAVHGNRLTIWDDQPAP